MVKFVSEYGRWLRAGYPVYFICTGSCENMHELSSVKNLTFFRRAATIYTQPLNVVRMSEMYRRKLHIDSAQAREMAKVTKGHTYAFQKLGALYFGKEETETLYSDIIPELKTELFSHYYENIWKEMAEQDRFLAKLIVIVLGSIVAAYGITLAMYAGFGGATLAVLWQGISQTFHISIGMASMVVALLMIAFVLFYDRAQLHIGTIL